jgi:hypothetical protein
MASKLPETYAATAALRPTVKKKFVPLFDHLLNLAQDDMKHPEHDGYRLRRAGQMLRQARKVAGY